MANREDGKKTREKLLKAASEVFATKGYRNATIAEICRKAGSNVAAVNYRFGSKDALYMAVWNNAFDQAIRAYPLDGGTAPDAPAEDHLRALIHSNVHRVLDAGQLGHAGQILLRETSSIMKNKAKLAPELIDTLVEHITCFSLAGIKVVRENIRASKA
jgi:AcrR family transcriptional regulator